MTYGAFTKTRAATSGSPLSLELSLELSLGWRGGSARPKPFIATPKHMEQALFAKMLQAKSGLVAAARSHATRRDASRCSQPQMGCRQVGFTRCTLTPPAGSG